MDLTGRRQLNQLIGAVDLLRHRTRLKENFGGPFNGQRRRIAIVEAILSKCDFTCAIETGTHRGTTTKYLSDHFPRVISIETQVRYLTFARLRLRKRKHVEVIEGNSGRDLGRVLGDLDSKGPVFAYLDAHWGGHLPLGDELQALERSGRDYIAVIDDFLVPGDKGYGFDSYRGGVKIDASYVFRSVPRLKHLWVPEAPSDVETGRIRGAGFLASQGLEPVLAELGELRLLKPVPRHG